MDDGEKFRKLRELRGYKQEYMAKCLGISIKAYSKLENGETAISLNRLRQVSRVLQIDPTEIIDFSEENIYRSCRQCAANWCPDASLTSLSIRLLAYQQRVNQLENQVVDLNNRLANTQKSC